MDAATQAAQPPPIEDPLTLGRGQRKRSNRLCHLLRIADLTHTLVPVGFYSWHTVPVLIVWWPLPKCCCVVPSPNDRKMQLS